MPKVSVIVPVYNVESYLEKCVRSILCQTERDFELLLIDDGSPDSSGALCDSLAETDPRIRVIHQENQGLGGARNTGIEAASGQWLLFVDSDDWIEPETLESALTAGEKAGAQLVVFGFRTVSEQGERLKSFVEGLPKNVGFSPREQRDVLLIYPAAWNKLYRAELFRHTEVRYPPRVWYEDIRTTPKLTAAAEKVVCTDFVGYNYLQRSGSIMKNTNIGRNREILDALNDLFTWFRQQDLFDLYRDELRHLAVYHCYLVASVRVIRIDRKNPLLREFSAFLSEIFPEYRQDPYLSRLTGNERLLLLLLEHKWYFLIELIFRIKGTSE